MVSLRGHALTYLAGGPAIAALTALLLWTWKDWQIVDSPRPVVHRALRGIVALGTVSYGAYLWNYPLTLWLRPHLGDGAGVVAAGATVAVAALSWRFVEQPALRLRRFTESDRLIA